MPRQQRPGALFERVVVVLEARARHILAREARLGSTSPLTGTARINDDELLDRFKRLRSSIADLTEATRRFMIDQPVAVDFEPIWPLLAEAEVTLTHGLVGPLTDTNVPARLERLWAALDGILLQLDRALQAAAELTDPALIRLTPDEIEALGDFPGVSPEFLKRIGRVIRLRDSAGRCLSETRALLVGRFHGYVGRGRPENIRGRQLAAHLLGMAEGMGLYPTRDHDNHSQSGADAVIAALKCCEGITDPAARIVFGETPKTFHAIARRLLPQCQEGEALFLDRQIGRVLGERHRT